MDTSIFDIFLLEAVLNGLLLGGLLALAFFPQEGLGFSRAEPRHKQSIVRLLRSQREVVAMTGYFDSGKIKLSSSALPSSLSPVMRMMYL